MNKSDIEQQILKNVNEEGIIEMSKDVIRQDLNGKWLSTCALLLKKWV